MKLLSTFYSRGDDLARGWWARIGAPNERRLLRHLWDDASGPDFDDLAALVAEATTIRGLDRALQLASENPQLVRRTKPVTEKPLPWEPAS
jgi:hypothetical protein